jgi:glucose-6-phosphate 1-dehydrogenase
MADEAFREDLREATKAALSCQGESVDAAKWEAFASRIFYHRGGYDNPAGFDSLERRLEELAGSHAVPRNRLYYLATPPVAFPAVVHQLGRQGMARRGRGGPWARIVVEKPFGQDLRTAQALNHQLHEVFDESQIFRIDHYLGKETVQNIMVLRFANSCVSPTASSSICGPTTA